MRILHTEWSDGLGGQEKRVLAESEGLSKKGHYVCIACRQQARIKNEAIKMGIDVITLPFRKLYDIESMIRLVRILRSEKFDVVNTHSGVDSWIGGVAGRIAGVPLLVRTRHLNIPLRRNILNFIHYLPHLYISCGENMRSRLINECGFPAEKVVSIPTGVDSSLFNVSKNNEAKIKYGLDVNSTVIANVGILRKVKGHEVTLKAARRVIESVPDARFLIVGDGPRRDALLGFAVELGISGQVVFTGYVENIEEIYSFADVTLLSSWSEGLPQGMLQAMAAGVPVVATGVGGVPEVIKNEVTGLLVDAGDDEALSEEIMRIIKNPELALRISENAAALVKQEHSMDLMVDKIENLYLNLLNR
jgi:glycosyltransferase involved in cell wall biosynthesis